ncbi:MAG: hypothetical protein ABIG11_05255 [bacterium]
MRLAVIAAAVIAAVFSNCAAEIFTLKDGTKITGAIKGSSEAGLEIETRYGVMTVERAKIASVSFARPGETVPETTQAEKLQEPAPAVQEEQKEITLKTIKVSTDITHRVYMADGKEVAKETVNKDGNVISKTGEIPDGVVRERYDNGRLKSEKTFKSGAAEGPAKGYFPDGKKIQTSAFYKNNKPEGVLKIYGDSGNLLYEQNFKDGLLDGFFREYDDMGMLRTEIFYREGQIAEKPSSPAKPAVQQDLLPAIEGLTVKTKKLARGIKYTFYLNNKYIASQVLDKKGNVINRNGKVPDGLARTYFKDGMAEWELTFLNGKLEGALRRFYESGKLKSETVYGKDEVLSRKLYGENGELIK